MLSYAIQSDAGEKDKQFSVLLSGKFSDGGLYFQSKQTNYTVRDPRKEILNFSLNDSKGVYDNKDTFTVYVNGIFPEIPRYEFVQKFTLSPGASIKVDGQQQASGSKISIYSDNISYVVTAEDGTFKNYNIKVNRLDYGYLYVDPAVGSNFNQDAEFLVYNGLSKGQWYRIANVVNSNEDYIGQTENFYLNSKQLCFVNFSILREINSKAFLSDGRWWSRNKENGASSSYIYNVGNFETRNGIHITGNNNLNSCGAEDVSQCKGSKWGAINLGIWKSTFWWADKYSGGDPMYYTYKWKDNLMIFIFAQGSEDGSINWSNPEITMNQILNAPACGYVE